MSRSRPNKNAKSPVQHYFEWSGSEGKLYFYDKEAKENVYFPKLKFVVLDELHTVTGFSDKHNNGIRGTEVRELDSPITVWIGKKKHSTDTYANLKTSVNGLKYAKSVYIGVIKKGGTMELAKLTLKGSAFSAWVNFLKGAEDYAENSSVDQFGEGVGISITGKSKQKKKGTTKYYEPKFESFDLSEQEDATAIELDSQLQEYFDNTPTSKDDNPNEEKEQTPATNAEDPEPEDDPEVEAEEEHEDAEDVDDLPF